MQNSKLFLPNSFIKRRRQFPMPLRFPFHGYKNVICKRAIHLRKNHHCLKCPSCRFSLFLSAKHRLNICGNILLNLHFVTVFWRCSSFHECRKRCGGRGGVGRLCDGRAGSLVKLHNGTRNLCCVDKRCSRLFLWIFSSKTVMQTNTSAENHPSRTQNASREELRASGAELHELGGDFTRLHIITYFARASMTLRKILQTSQPYICRN